jgi:hypothetical protein
MTMWRSNEPVEDNMRPRNELTLLPKSPLLITESADEFEALRDAFEQEIKPRGIIEQMYVHDISSIVWACACGGAKRSSSIRPSAAHWSTFSRSF